MSDGSSPQGLRIVVELQCLDARSPRHSRENVVRLLPLKPPGPPMELVGLSGTQLLELGPLYGKQVVLHIEADASAPVCGQPYVPPQPAPTILI
jgi:hypothetical protein